VSAMLSLTSPSPGLTVGDPIRIAIEFRLPPRSTLRLQTPASDRRLERREVSPWRFRLDGAEWIARREETWAAFAPGPVSLAYDYRIEGTAGSSVGRLVSPSCAVVSVLSAGEKDPAPAAFRPPTTLPTVSPAMLVAGLALAAAVASAAAILLRRRRRRTAARGAQTAHAALAREIDRLRRRLADIGPDDELFDGLAGALRAYLEARLERPAKRLTSREIGAWLTGDPRMPAAEVARALTTCDGCRFARRPPDTGEPDVALSSAEAAAVRIEAVIAAESA